MKKTFELNFETCLTVFVVVFLLIPLLTLWVYESQIVEPIKQELIETSCELADYQAKYDCPKGMLCAGCVKATIVAEARG